MMWEELKCECTVDKKMLDADPQRKVTLALTRSLFLLDSRGKLQKFVRFVVSSSYIPFVESFLS